MKKIVVLGLTIVFVLSACGGSVESAAGSTDAGAAPAGQGSVPQAALSPMVQNIVGLFRLEDTDLAVDTTQAKTLLPLWQAYRSLLESDTTAAAELEAIQTQISQALTDEQHDAIAALNLSPEDMSSLMDELGVTPFGAAAGERAGLGGDLPSGSGPAGGMVPPAGGFVPGQGMGQGAGPGATAEGLDPQVIATLQASRPAGRQGDRFSLALLDPLIELLKERAGA
jgi:hypothetical protein